MPGLQLLPFLPFALTENQYGGEEYLIRPD